MKHDSPKQPKDRPPRNSEIFFRAGEKGESGNRGFLKSIMENPEDWAAYKVERRAVSALEPYANNPRTHTDEQIAQNQIGVEQRG